LCGSSIPVIVGDGFVLERALRYLPRGKRVSLRPFPEASAGEAELLDLRLLKEARPGATDGRYGEASYRYILEALKLVFNGAASAVVTCPISKASLRLAGIDFPGHTELLAHFGGVTDFVMMMANRTMRVALVTIHVSLREVPSLLTADRILSTIRMTHHSLAMYFGIGKPRIKVCGLNPHAGEGGIMGTEERFIEEAVDRARRLSISAEGPFPADTLFHRRDCDAYVAMYHDQGLIPVKTVDFPKTVNITLGLPFIRTSPGHGTGFDIAGKGLADPTGLVEAYRVAWRMARGA
jgi:4-hydroxythreonine-4-phosphate dehydrogenase